MRKIKVKGLLDEYATIKVSKSELKLIYHCHNEESHVGVCEKCIKSKVCDIFFINNLTTPNGYSLPKNYNKTNNWLKFHGLPMNRKL